MKKKKENEKVDRNSFLGPYLQMILCTKWSVFLYPVTCLHVIHGIMLVNKMYTCLLVECLH